MERHLSGFNVSSQKRKIEINIKRYGGKYLFTRFTKNEFNEISDEIEKTIEITGLYHSNQPMVSSTSDSAFSPLMEKDAGRISRRRKPEILCLFEEYEQDPIKIDDRITLDNLLYRVIDLLNIGLADIAYSIELELIV